MKISSTSIQNIKNEMTDGLSGLYEKNEAGNIASLLIEHVCKMDKTRQISDSGFIPGRNTINKLNQLFNKLMSGMPIQYVLGETEFYGRKFHVNPSVLIPRPETEEMVDLCIRNYYNTPDLRILDIGTGSGIVAVSLAAELNSPVMYACDVSGDILQVAKQNAALHDVDVTFLCNDIMKNPDDLPSNLDCIVSNPPYVTNKEKLTMHKNVLDFEPKHALFVPDNDPVIFYRQIARIANKKLKTCGMIICEINAAYARESIKCFSDLNFCSIFVHDDLNKNDRILIATKP